MTGWRYDIVPRDRIALEGPPAAKAAALKPYAAVLEGITL